MIHSKPIRSRTTIHNAITMLEAEHAAATDMLTRLVSAGAATRDRERVIALLSEEMRVHLQIEEELLYPTLAARASGPCEPPSMRPALKAALRRLDLALREGGDLAQHLTTVLSLHQADSSDEERRIFPHARRAFRGAALVALGERLRARRRELQSTAAPAPDVARLDEREALVPLG